MCVIYEPKGKAREYSALACNLYRGCGHGCVYCYAPSATRRDRNEFYGRPAPRNDIIKQISKEIQALKKPTDSPVLLCFTCDPYQPIEEKLGITRCAINIFDSYGVPVQVLTKGGLLAARDFDILKLNPGNKFSVTLTTDNPEESAQWEPGAAPPEERIQSLKMAHDLGISTWVSFEPVFNPDAVLRLIEKTHEFVDLYKVGKLNYHPAANGIDWKQFGHAVKTCLEYFGKSYYLKEDLKNHMQ